MATWVVFVPAEAVGAVGVPVKAGDLVGAFVLTELTRELMLLELEDV